jgi:heme O synthase-like polyprenyltransferase
MSKADSQHALHIGETGWWLMNASNLNFAIGIASIILAIVSMVVSIVSSLWAWQFYKSGNEAQRQSSALLSQVSEKVDLVASHTSLQVGHAMELLSGQTKPEDIAPEHTSEVVG